MNWGKAREAGARFAFIRAGSIDNITGECYTDYQFDRNSSVAPGIMPVGYYWYFRPNHDTVKQAEYFMKLLEGKTRQLPIVCDIEVKGLASEVRLFCELMSSYANERMMIYTSPNAWNEYIIGSKEWADDYPLWIAHWGTIVPTVPFPWSKYAVWQTHVGNDGFEFGADSTRIDHDLAQDWLLEPLPPEPPSPPPTIEGLILEVVQEGLRIRTGPGTNYTQIGVLKQGDVIRPTDTGGSSAWVEFDHEGGKAWSNVQYGTDRNMEPLK